MMKLSKRKNLKANKRRGNKMITGKLFVTEIKTLPGFTTALCRQKEDRVEVLQLYNNWRHAADDLMDPEDILLDIEAGSKFQDIGRALAEKELNW